MYIRLAYPIFFLLFLVLIIYKLLFSMPNVIDWGSLFSFLGFFKKFETWTGLIGFLAISIGIQNDYED